ncbi:NAD+ synthase [Sphaerobacter sp.]|uniref:NAD+ synthase n=1 Tax=Sphaerobacter sp. TaxID=2099654 RepID=UPI001D64D584|nr:NAD+ synthase [Sphaerobacter sp.]MBX5445382.1 NAD+ synthase [Sphaerobacter sp.]
MSLADQIAAWIKEQVAQAGVQGGVVGLSGGIDSAVVAGLATRALGPERVTAAIMPAHSNPQDVEHAKLAAAAFGLEPLVIDLSRAYDVLRETLPPGSEMANANIKPRLRMITLYHLANTRNALVIGTGNKSEEMVGYFTKYGDGGVDILPIGGLYKHQVVALAREIGVPEPIITKPPSAGLWAGQTDEGEMGITYDELDAILAAIERGDTTGFPPDKVARVERMIASSEHKRRLPPIFEPAGAEARR